MLIDKEGGGARRVGRGGEGGQGGGGGGENVKGWDSVGGGRGRGESCST